jgi:AraC family transcriptional regulator
MPAGLRLNEHAHEPGQICYVLEGEYRERANGREYRFKPGALQFHFPGEPHSNVFAAGSEVLTLLVSVDANRWTRVAAPRPVAPGALLRNCVAEIRRELHQNDDAAQVALEAWSMLSLSELARTRPENAHEPPWMQEAAAEIERKLGDPISLHTIAESVGVHRATLAAGFRRFRHSSVGEWIRQRRVHHVRRFLLTSKMPLCEVATQVGFHDQAHMTRVFRDAIGMSPGEYRSAAS